MAIATAKIPKPSEPVVDPDTGLMSRNWYLYNQQQDQAAKANATATDAAVTTYGKSVSVQLFFPYPENGDSFFIGQPLAWTASQVITRTITGTATVTVTGSAAFGGGPNAATTSSLTVAHTSANSVAAGGDLKVSISAVSGDCTGLSVTIIGAYA